MKRPMDIRVKAVLQAAVMVGVGCLFFFRLHHFWGPIFIWSFAAVILITGLFVEAVNIAIEHFFSKYVARWVGTGMTYLLLTPFYFLVFAPAHWLLKARHLDPMHREFPSKEPTYWIPRKPVIDVAQYKKQH